jgi:hypothetical protein
MAMVGLAAAGAPAPTGIALIGSPEADWPQWRGRRRDGICEETGLRREWPAGGPRLLWKSAGLGQGYACPIVHSNRVYIAGDAGERLALFALDLGGRVIWRSQNGASWKGAYPGARACLAYRNGRLFHMNAHGRVVSLDAATGTEQWAVNVTERWGGKMNTWAYSECVLVDGDHVIVTPGGPQASMAALDAQTGATVWTTEPIILGADRGPAQLRLPDPAGEADPASYTSPILVQVGNQRQIIGCSLRHAFGVDADTGRLLWTQPMPTAYSVIAATPVLVQDNVFITAPDLKGGGQLLPLRPERPAQVEQSWTTPLDTCQAGVIYHAGSLYGSWYRNHKGWVCVDAQTGAVRYQFAGQAMGPVIWADDRLYWLSQEGEMFLLRPTEKEFVVAGRFRLTSERKSDVWTHPVICRRRLYLRDQETLFCYDIAAQ